MKQQPDETGGRPVAILATHTECDDEWTDLLVDYIVKTDASLGSIVLFASPAMEGRMRSAGVPAHVAVVRVEAGDDMLAGWKLFRTMRTHTPGGFSVVAANTRAEHVAAVLTKLHSRRPVAVVKARLRQQIIRKNLFTKWFENHWIGVNLYLRKEDRDFQGAQRAPFIRLDRPCLLDQPRFGEDSKRLMLDHAINALTSPTRRSITGRKRDLSHIELAYITHFYFNQRDASTAIELLRHYASYDRDLLDRIHFVFVDDGSPISYEIPDVDLNLTWLKIREDIPWNMAGARNLGAMHARCDKIILTDIDNIFPEHTLRGLVERKPCGKRFYKFWRLNRQDNSLYRGHPNIFFLSRGRFFELYGYDEEFAGSHGAEDFRFVKYQKANGSIQMHLPKKLYIIDRKEINREVAYHTLLRDLSLNTPVDYRKRIEMESYGNGAGHSRMFLNFKWEVALERWRTVNITRPVDKWWKRLWLLRSILPRY